MKEIAVALSVCACLALCAIVSCGDDESTVADAGGASGAQTEAYFALSGTKTYHGTQELDTGTSPIDYDVAYAADTTTFNGRATIKRTWTTGGFLQLTEWFEVKGDKLYFLRYQYMDKNAKLVDIAFPAATPVLYGKDPWSDADPALSTTVGSDLYEYSLVMESVTVPAGTFDGAFKVYANEAGRNSLYYFVPSTGVVKYQINKHPALGTIAIELK